MNARYVMVKYSKDMLLFDERFVNYGCNKVQWINLLRLSGTEKERESDE